MAEKPTYSYGDQYKTSKDLPRDQQKLAEAAAQGTDQKQDVSGFLNKGITSFLGGAVDFTTGLVNDMSTLKSKTMAPIEKRLGMESKPPKLLDPNEQFGGTASFRRGFENLGYNIPDREPETFLEGFAQGTGELGSYLIPQTTAPKLLGAVNTTLKVGAFNPYDDGTDETSAQPSAQPSAPVVNQPSAPVVNQAEEPTYTYGDQYKTDSTPATPATPANPANPVAPAAPVVPSVDNSMGIGMGTGDQPYVLNNATKNLTGKSSDLPLNMDEMSALADRNSAENFSTPMTGMRPINSETGEPLPQSSIDAITNAGYEPSQASVPMAPKTERELAVAANEARLQAIRDGAPLGNDALIATGQMTAPEGYNDRPQQPTQAPNTSPANPQTGDRVDSMSDLGAKMNADFVKFQRSGREMTPEMRQKADQLALSVGRTFDPVAGYSPDFSPELMEEFNRRVEAGIIDPSKLTVSGGQQNQARPQAPSAQGTSGITQQDESNLSSYEKQSLARQRRIGGTGSYEGDSAAMQERLQEPSTFNDVKFTVMGKTVSDTPENRRLRNQESLLKKQGRDEGLSGSALRGFVENGMQDNADKDLDRTQEEEDRATQKIKDDLNISTSQADLALKRAKQLEVPKLPIGTVKAILGTLAENGISYDLETGALTTADERFMLPDGTVNLSPNSAIYKLLEGVEGAEAFFAAPPSVEAKRSEAQEGQIVRADDGRIYRFVGGEFVHIL